MKLSKIQLIDKINIFKEKFHLKGGEVTDFKFYPKIGKGENYWIVTQSYELFGEIENFFYMISDDTGVVIQTMNGHGINPHLGVQIEDEALRKEWEDFDEEEFNKKNTLPKENPKSDKPKGDWSVLIRR
ncbi:hypothetical protein OIU80_17575 [Flavobacterium sp. LS1R47]|uniref:Uncharacterized protein n=1 Tax=Flavobacterium frigoritolerans TaxID=2987686 RepID=A0A9X3C9I7_9FLAO|nr:hypothetical protein [Flavobacterium frigoritolerans]MCV9934095.1 hypothetical protein [Flavobacterium frigoritolerans]